MNISIYTFTMGREKYLLKNVNSYPQRDNIEHHVCFQGCSPINLPNKCISHLWDTNVGIASGMNKILPLLKGDIIMKMDDDCEIISSNFFDHVTEIHSLKPDLVFSPYPVGLINNPGGVKGHGHEVIYSEKLDTYYTLRYVYHVGGFARISPGFTKNWKFQHDLLPGMSGNEDGQFSAMCRSQNIKMAYLENAIIVEHQESTLGQHARYKEDYFKGRF